MNAKKIMGAVLVALLAAALFVGAGAAASNGDTVFVYEAVTDGFGAVGIAGSWTHANGVDTITFTPLDGSNYAIIGADIVEGTYTKGAGTNAVSITVKYPTALISATGKTATNIVYPVGTYYDVTGSSLTFRVADVGNVADLGIVVIGADGVARPFVEGIDFTSGTALTDVQFEAMFPVEGTYKLQAYFEVPMNIAVNQLIPTTPANAVSGNTQILLGKDVFTITIVDGADPTVTAVADSVIVENTIELTITGLPGAQYAVSFTGNAFDIPAQAVGFTGTAGNIFTMPNTGKVTIVLEAQDKTGDFTITVTPQGVAGEEAEVDIEVVGGTITAAADKDAYYIGNKVTITGTSTAGANVYFYIAGTNIEFTEVGQTDVKNGEFKEEFAGDDFRFLDAGTYTLYVSANTGATEVKDLKTYTTVALILKQPFISVTEAPSVAVKGTTYKVTGTAEAADDIFVYIFGTNFFAAANESHWIGEIYMKDAMTVNVKKNEFTVEIEIPSESGNMSAGQYFMVVQHPMYDKLFNVAPFLKTTSVVNGVNYGNPYITMNVSGEATENSPVIVDVYGRQKANAAQALCDNLDSENVDDMYVKLSFVVGAPQSVINPIPAEVAKGTKLTVSGSTNVGEGEVVTVEMLSTAFAAVPKSTVGSASFISLVTKTDENGNWEVTFDTTGLNVDEYTVTAAVEALGSAATAKVNVIEGAPVNPDQPDTPDVPDTPDTPDTPDVPETPGFGALAALAGLGAVAVLLLRRE